MPGNASTERFSVVLPVMNRGCSIPTTVPVPLSDKITFRKIRGDDLAVITEHDDEAAGLLKGGTYTLTIEDHDPKMGDQDLNRIVLAALFSLNVLGSGTPLSVEKAYVVRSLRKTSISSVNTVPGHHHSNSEKFKIEKGTELSYAKTLFSGVCSALSTHPPLRITISRFNSSMGRAAVDDKLIDLCIALESVFQSRTEISFQFALYNSLLSESDTDRRIGIFKTLKKLYGQRSNVVHGNKDLDIEWMQNNWNDLLRIAKASILRKVEFLGSKGHDEWKAQLETMALGSLDG